MVLIESLVIEALISIETSLVLIVALVWRIAWLERIVPLILIKALIVPLILIKALIVPLIIALLIFEISFELFSKLFLDVFKILFVLIPYKI